jgi:hypothetical protein
MYKEAKLFLVFSLVVMIVMGYGVRAYLLAPQQPVGGPVPAHGLTGKYAEGCDICHRDKAEWHLTEFTVFADCMNCHGGAPGTPHDTTGNFANCTTCHGQIQAGHDDMFGFPGTTYEDCLLCHIPE